LGGVFAASASLCIALAPYTGRALLPFSTLFTWLCLLATCLRVRSWRSPLSADLMFKYFAAMMLVGCLLLVQFFTESPQWHRVVLSVLVTMGLLVWLLRELQMGIRQQSSMQLYLMVISAMGMVVVLVLWAWVLLSPEFADHLFHFSPSFSEAAWAFAIRLFLVAMLVLLLTGANGYGTERLVGIKAALSHEFIRTQALNQQLQEAIHEKNEMLHSLSFAVRAQNLPAIASSLTHEINQPLGALRLNIDHMLAEIDQMSPSERQDVLVQMVKCTEATHSVVVSFRRFFEVQSDWKRFDLQVLLDDLMHGLRTDFLRKSIQVQWMSGPPVFVKGDQVQLETAVTGVIEHMSGALQKLCQSFQVNCTFEDRMVAVRVLAIGVDLPNTEFQQLLDQSNKVKSMSFSPGLWLSRAIVEHHGGAVSVCEYMGSTGIALMLPFSKESE
jgi:signal transduction histidine kinase